MAQRTEIILIDDVDGSNASETIEFALDGVSYEIDLSDQNAARLRDAFEEWVNAGRKTGGARKRKGATASPARSTSADRSAYLKDLREWAKENGHDVSDRGRVPADVEQAYAAHIAS